jgi:hypothetical protein
MYQTTTANKPPMKTSDEAKQEQLEMAKEQGRAYKKALEHMANEEALGETKAAGNYHVSYAVEAAEGMYHLMDGGLVWHEPQHENAHIEIAVQDGADMRFIPGLTVHVTVVDETNSEVGTHQQPFLWHPWLYHYGRNWELPGDGEYTIRVHIDAPDFMRHDKENGKRYADPVDVEFTKVKIKTGQK